MNTQQTQELARNLIRLALEFKSTDAGQASEVKRAFKTIASKNDLVRITTYLMEVVGVRDMQYNQLKDENTDLKELLKLNNISLGEEDETKTEATEQSAAAAPVANDGQLPLVDSSQASAEAGVQAQSNTEA
jgi:hypothetical protein